MEIGITHYVILASLLFGIGVFGVLVKKNTIVMLMCVELMLGAVNLLLVVFSKVHASEMAQIFVFFVMIVAAAEVTIGLALIVLLYRLKHTVDVDALHQLKH